MGIYGIIILIKSTLVWTERQHSGKKKRLVPEREKDERILSSLSLPTYSLFIPLFIVSLVFLLCFFTPNIF